MNGKSVIWTTICLTALTVPPHAGAGLGRLLFPKPELEVTINSRVLPAGAEQARPTPEKPVYYVAVSAGLRDFGAPIPGDKAPPKSEMIRMFTRTLEKEGYRLATNKNPPTLVITYAWGTLYSRQLLLDQPGDLMYLNAGAFVERDAARWSQLGRLPELESGLKLFDYDAPQADHNYYAFVLTAYDLDAARKRNEVRPLWQMRVRSPSTGLAMSDSLPKMVAIAGPHMGRDPGKLVHVRADEHYKPSVEIGTLTVVPEGSDPE